jgi:hypothetical protein
MISKSLLLILLLSLLANISCQTFAYGPPRTAHARNAAQSDPQTFDSMEKKDKKDPLGTLLLIGFGIAAGIASATLVPLALTHKL